MRKRTHPNTSVLDRPSNEYKNVSVDGTVRWAKLNLRCKDDWFGSISCWFFCESYEEYIIQFRIRFFFELTHWHLPTSRQAPPSSQCPYTTMNNTWQKRSRKASDTILDVVRSRVLTALAISRLRNARDHSRLMRRPFIALALYNRSQRHREFHLHPNMHRITTIVIPVFGHCFFHKIDMNQPMLI